MVFSVNQKSRTFPTDPVLIFSGTENSRSFPTVDDDIELDSFTDVAIDETTESKATKSKIKTEAEHSRSLLALEDNIELDSFTDVAIDETTESKATKSKNKTEVDHSRSLPALERILNSTVLLMLLSMKQQNQKPQRVKLKQK